MRLFVVSNRLPISVTQKEGDISFKKSVGGLAVGLSSYLETLKKDKQKSEYIWVGWPGEIPEGIDQEDFNKKLKKKNLLPVFLNHQEIDSFYNGFCNDTLWPLFHYFTSFVSYNNEWWESYKRVNEEYARVLLEELEPNDTVWVHDFHLMLLPYLLRERLPDLSIGFFLHIPFPHFELYRLLPPRWRKQMLQGVLGSDLIGFHTYDYSQYFLDSVQRILGYESNMGVLSVESRKVKVDTFPMGIHYEKFATAARAESTQKEKEKVKEVTKELKIILSIDRLDYTKGILKRLKAYEYFLNQYPEWKEKIVFLLTVVPSRVDIDKYQEMKRSIDEIVGNINGAFGTLSWTPIIYQYKSLTPQRLSALYAMSDIALVTPLRDGMNLIAKEYVASRIDESGVLILSEMAGAAQELGESIIINPNHVEEIADALADGLSLSLSGQQLRMRAMQKRLRSYTVIKWAEDFLTTLGEFKVEQQKEQSGKFLGTYRRGEVVKSFYQAHKKVVFLDYDGTLVPYGKFPLFMSPDKELLTLLAKLGQLKQTDVVILSGREKWIMERWFDVPGIHLVAEHGVWIREKGKEWNMLEPFQNTWKESVLPVFERYAQRLPGSFIEEKEFSIAWHYRMANQELAQIRARELMSTLMHFTTNMGIQVVQGNKIIEVRNAGADKGTAARYFLGKKEYDWKAAIGDDTTDEDMFGVLSEDGYSIKVGGGPTQARLVTNSYHDVRAFLNQIVEK